MAKSVKFENLIRSVPEPVLPTQGLGSVLVIFLKQVLDYIRALFKLLTPMNLNTLPDGTPPCVLIEQVGEEPSWLTIPDLTKVYALMYDPGDGKIKWVECRPDCPS